jgi:hypothetical protein
MAAEGASVTRERLTEIIGQNALAPHLNPIFEAIRDFGVRALIVPQCKDNLAEALDEAHDASIVIIGDDTDRALGPSGFHVSSLRRLFRMADHVAVIGSAPPVGVYASLSAIASLERCFVVIIETRPEEEIAWVDFVKSANPELPILLVTTEAGRA